jgi:hypothetical protein
MNAAGASRAGGPCARRVRSGEASSAFSRPGRPSSSRGTPTRRDAQPVPDPPEDRVATASTRASESAGNRPQPLPQRTRRISLLRLRSDCSCPAPGVRDRPARPESPPAAPQPWSTAAAAEQVSHRGRWPPCSSPRAGPLPGRRDRRRCVCSCDRQDIISSATPAVAMREKRAPVHRHHDSCISAERSIRQDRELMIPFAATRSPGCRRGG